MMIGGTNYITLYLGFVKIRLYFDIYGYKFTPLDYKMMLDIVNYRSVCHSLTWSY